MTYDFNFFILFQKNFMKRNETNEFQLNKEWNLNYMKDNTKKQDPFYASLLTSCPFKKVEISKDKTLFIFEVKRWKELQKQYHY